VSTEPGNVTAHKALKCADGIPRIISARNTLDRIRGLQPVMGITRVANVTGLDSIGIPVVMVCRPNSRGLAVSQGKGPSLEWAKASGVMESVEAWHAERIQLPLKLATFHEMSSSHSMASIADIPRPEQSTFHGHKRLLWIAGEELNSGETRWVPFEAVHCDFTLPFPEGSGAFHQSSNGLASGNHRLEAISHAICELIERDASTLWYYAGDKVQERRRLNLESVDDPACVAVLERYRQAAVEVAVWETTSDIGLPSFDCLIVPRELDPVRPLPAAFGAGCHPTRAIALLRALTEAAQSRLTSIAGSRDDIDRPGHDRSHETRTLRALHKLVTSGRGIRSFRDAPDFHFPSFDEDVALELERLRACGLPEVIAVNLTRDDLEIPVVKVVIPGLEAPHRLPGYVPGPRVRSGGYRKLSL
jgi:ribosomal protein S12 methylthiotransferase accessory factor